MIPRTMIPRTSFVPVLLLGGALLLAACGKSPAEAATEAAIRAATGEDVKVERDGEKVTFQTDEGEMTIAGGEDLELPADFPDDVYLPPGYQVKSLMNVAQASIVQLAAPGSLAGLSDAADDAMLGHGWKQTMAMQQDDFRMYSYEKGERAASLTLSPGEGEQVQISMQLRNSRQ